MSFENIIILANKYPNEFEPNVNVFTQQLSWCLADLGYKCFIICPNAINYNNHNKKMKLKYTEITDNNNTVEVYRPRYFGFGQEGKFAQKFRVMMTTNLYIRSIESILPELPLQNAVLFAEFLCPAGVAASIIGKRHDVKSFMQCGEAIYKGDQKYGNKKLAKKLLSSLTGVIAVSGQNKDYLVNAGVVPRERIIVLPSGYRADRIFPRDKTEARVKLNLPQDKFIVGFCGSYDERKGVLRLEKAIDQIDNDDIVLAAVGKGNCKPTSRKCVFTGTINHKELAYFYSAIDVFAFPTYHEGCCTAIVEAIACGCPIISSDRAFNYEICDSSNSILIDPDNIQAMKDSILQLYHDPALCCRLSEGSRRMSQGLRLDEKAKRIVEFMRSVN